MDTASSNHCCTRCNVLVRLSVGAVISVSPKGHWKGQIEVIARVVNTIMLSIVIVSAFHISFIVHFFKGYNQQNIIYLVS